LATDEIAIPVDLIGVVDAGEQESDIFGGGTCESYLNMETVPGVAGVARMALNAPGPVARELLPLAVVEGRN
jgi:hypothetical protein